MKVRQQPNGTFGHEALKKRIDKFVNGSSMVERAGFEPA